MKRLLSTGAVGALLLGSSVLTAPPAHAAAPHYAVMLLGPTPGMMDSIALGINARGDVVGASVPARPTIDGGGLSTIWEARRGVGATVAPGFPNSSASDISSSGEIVGNYFQVGPPAVYWYADGAAQQVMDPETGFGLFGTAHHVSETGVAVLNAYKAGPTPAAFLATSASELTELLPPAQTSDPSATGISDDGRLVAGSAHHGTFIVPVIWTDGSGTRLNPLPGVTESRLEAINSSGEAVGCGVTGAGERPVRYSPTGTPSALPLLAGARSTCATAINDAGMIAGNASLLASNGSVAVVWFEGMAHDLNGLVASRSGYSLTTVSDINDSGQIVGTATLADGTRRGYIATPSTAESIYTSPGYHNFNGRLWKTACEPYSQTSRCRTEIVATTVQYVNGHYIRVTDWTFNNLTYVPSPRKLWANNPLGNTGTWTAADGRRWRTECDTLKTGRNGCRSYTWVKVATATPDSAGGYTYTVASTWVFNNIVKFT